MKVCVYAFQGHDELENWVNKFINNKNDIEIIDIQFQVTRGLINLVFSAMIIYKEVRR